MALDIRDGVAKPAFYYGVEYGGAFEPYLLSLINRFFEPSTRVYRGTMAAFLAGTVLGLWSAARLACGRRAGLLVGLCAALSPAYFYYKVLTSDGAYASLTFFGVLTLLLTVEVERRLAAGLRAGSALAALGASCGLAFWIHLAAIPYLAVALAAGLSWLLSRRIGALESCLAVAGGFAGSLPWWVRNVETRFASLTQDEVSLSEPAKLASRTAALVTESLPIAFGPTSFRGWHPPIWIGLLLVATLAAVLLVAGREARRGMPPAMRRLYYSSFLLVGAGVVTFLAARIARPSEPRYLLPALIGFATLNGLLLASLLRRPSARLAVAIAPLVFAVASHVRAPRLRDFQRMTSDDPGSREILFAEAGAVLRELSNRGIRSVYGSYWTVYRLVFLSSRAVAGTPFGRIAVDRIPAMTLRAQGDPAPAFLLDGADRTDMENYLTRTGNAAERTRVGGLVLYSGLSSGAIAELRAANRVPVP